MCSCRSVAGLRWPGVCPGLSKEIERAPFFSSVPSWSLPHSKFRGRKPRVPSLSVLTLGQRGRGDLLWVLNGTRGGGPGWVSTLSTGALTAPWGGTRRRCRGFRLGWAGVAAKPLHPTGMSLCLSLGQKAWDFLGLLLSAPVGSPRFQAHPAPTLQYTEHKKRGLGASALLFLRPEVLSQSFSHSEQSWDCLQLAVQGYVEFSKRSRMRVA